MSRFNCRTGTPRAPLRFLKRIPNRSVRRGLTAADDWQGVQAPSASKERLLTCQGTRIDLLRLAGPIRDFVRIMGAVPRAVVDAV